MSTKLSLPVGLILASLLAVGCGSTSAHDPEESVSSATGASNGNGIGATSATGSTGSTGTSGTSGTTGTESASTESSSSHSSASSNSNGATLATATTGSSGTSGTTGTTGTTGAMQCNIGCTSDLICQTDCPGGGAGTQNCCDASGICYLSNTTTCPVIQDAGTTGTFY